jgi:hypothetical protein
LYRLLLNSQQTTHRQSRAEPRAEAEAEAEAEEREIKRFIFICKFDQESNLLMHHTQTGN